MAGGSNAWNERMGSVESDPNPTIVAGIGQSLRDTPSPAIIAALVGT